MAGLDVVANPPILAMKDTSSYTTVLMLYNASQASSSQKNGRKRALSFNYNEWEAEYGECIVA